MGPPEKALTSAPDRGWLCAHHCRACGAKTIEPGPAKYSPEDHYGKYRRALKREARGRAKQG